MTERERFERYKAAERGIEYERFKLIRDIHEENYGVRYHQLTQMASDWKVWQAATAQAVPQGEMFYALKDEYFEGQYFELECVIDDFESDYGGGDILEVLCAEITTVKHPNKFITTLGHGKTQLFGTSEEAKQAIKAAQENDQ